MLPFVAAIIQSDPYLLEIGPPGRVTVQVDQIVNTSNGRPASAADVAAAARGLRFVYLGESHNSPDHHQMQANVIEALVADGRDVVVGFEQFTRPVQDSLNPWTLGWWDEATFIERSQWKTQWGFDYALYRPIFESTRKHKLPMVALNVPRDWVRAVGRGGYTALTAEQKKELPTDLYLGNANHKAVFTGLMGGHPMTGPQGDNVYSAQVLWDEGMADTALKYMDKRGASTNTVFVVVAGSGHVMYGQGINYRVERRTSQKGITMTMFDGTEPREVSRGLGDFVYMAKPGK
jgi:uncharacterized iron-regulated protein